MADTPMHLKIFLSHSSQDKAACDALVGALRDPVADVWYDEHNLGAGQLLEEIQRELQARPVFLVLLSKNAFASQWVLRETKWAFNLYNREPERLILPITVGKIDKSDFNDPWLFLEDFKRVEAQGLQPYSTKDMVDQTLRLLALQPAMSLEDLLTQGRTKLAQKKYSEALAVYQRVLISGPPLTTTFRQELGLA